MSAPYTYGINQQIRGWVLTLHCLVKKCQAISVQSVKLELERREKDEVARENEWGYRLY